MTVESIMAFSIGIQIGTVYARLLDQVVSGDFIMVILSLLFILFSVLNPIYGYVPKINRQYDVLRITFALVLCYSVPNLSVIPLGVIVALNSIELFMKQTSWIATKNIRLTGIAGFLFGRNQWVTNYVDFLGMLGPVYLLLESLSEGGDLNPETAIRFEERIFTKHELLSLKPEFSEVPVELQSLRLVPWREMRKTKR